MDNQEIIAQVTEFCEAAFIEVFHSQRCSIQRCYDDNVIPYFEHVAIDAHCEEMYLVLRLSLPRPVLVASYPTQDEVKSIEESNVNDWYLELANRLLGSLKNRLAACLSPMRLGIPKLVPSSESDEVFAASHNQVPLLFEFDGIAMGCNLGISIPGRIESLDQAELDCVEGELELF